MGQRTKYRVQNWKDYNRSLVQRGSLTVWFSEDSIEQWLAKKGKGRRGRPHIYSDDAILTALMIRYVFHLPLRALQGFLTSLVMLMNIDLPVPDYTRICRRAKSLGQELKKLSNKRVTDLVIDSTGLKVYGEGEWKVRQHGYNKRRTWRKAHFAVCPDSHEIMFEVLTENSAGDCEIYPEFLEAAPEEVERTYGDGAYDTEGCYFASHKHGSKLITPPQKNAKFRKNAPPHMEGRNVAWLEILGFGGDEIARKLWKKLVGYHVRSLAETAMFRFKEIFGIRLRSRCLPNQKAEVYAKSNALNVMTRLGMPQSVRVAA
jgi:IS5 family transposase